MKLADSSSWNNIQTWTMIRMSCNRINQIHTEIVLWTKDNGSDQSYCVVWDGFRFENSKDAVLFALRWS